MTRITAVFLFFVFTFQIVSAQLPDIAKEDLVQKIRVQENKIKAFNMKYKLSGSFKLDESDKEKLVPHVVIEFEYARNIAKGYWYMHERWITLIKGQEYERKYAYNGKTGTRLVLKLPDDPNRMYGYITNKIPDIFNDEASWKPKLSTYEFVDTNDSLSVIIEKDTNAKVTTEEFNGEQVYKVSFSTPHDIEITDPQTGKKRIIETRENYAALISPKRSYQPLKISRLRNGTDESSFCLAFDFRESEPGILLPWKIERYRRQEQRPYYVIDINSITLNKDATVISYLKFPEGTRVRDEISGIRYIATEEE